MIDFLNHFLDYAIYFMVLSIGGVAFVLGTIWMAKIRRRSLERYWEARNRLEGHQQTHAAQISGEQPLDLRKGDV